MKKFVRGTLIGLAACVIGLSSIALRETDFLLERRRSGVG